MPIFRLTDDLIFPPPELAGPEGLLAVGGDLKPERLLLAYKNGIFYRMIGTNAVYHDKTLLDKEWYISTDVSPLFAQVIFKLHNCQSVNELLDNRDIIKNLLEKKN